MHGLTIDAIPVSKNWPRIWAALKRYRTGGEQKFTVKHVTVISGGQAIVGNISPGAQREVAPKEPARLTVSDEVPLTGIPPI